MRILTGLFFIVLSSLAYAGSPLKVESVRLWQAPDSLRLVFDTSSPADDHRLFLLSHPDRVVIDLKHAVPTHLMLPEDDVKNSWLKGIRSAEQPNGVFRVVLDLKRRVTPSSFVLRPNSQYGDRLVVDLKSASASNETQPQRAEDPATPVEVKSASDLKSGRDIIVAVDAGHGGEDPGATGPNGTHEKTITLQVARRLAALINKTPGMHAMMTRDGDYYVSLRDRIRKARAAKADLFVSIHADSYKHNRHARGSTVFALSKSGATSEAARWLAESENQSDLIGGVSLDDKSHVLASVLLDLSQTASIEASLDVGKYVLNNLKQVGPIHRSRVEQAAFVVLKSPDIPSILVETDFISNPVEERKLKDATYQENIAKAVLKGVRAYFRQNPPPGTLLAMQNAAKQPKQAHVIQTGETLSSIAHEYKVSLKAIRASNDLDSDQLQVGQVIKIPVVYGG